jgi:hypothetical protein
MRFSLDFVFVKSVVAAPVVYEHDRVATHSWSVTAASTNVISNFVVGLL